MTSAAHETTTLPRAASRRRPRRAAVAGLAAVAVLAAATGAFAGSLPSVAGAPARVAAILRAHGGTAVPVAPSARVARAVVAAEDERFFSHGAIDPIAIGRVIVSTVTGGPSDPGGSTIAQQLAKTLYTRGRETLAARLREVGLAFALEHRYSRPRVLSMYLNAIYFGHGLYGVGAASRGYFGRPPGALGWGQAALLAGLPQAPSAFDPLRHPSLARARQREVLAQLVRTGALGRAAAARAARAPLALR